MRMRSNSKYINTSSGPMFIAGDRFSNPNFLYDTKMSPVNQRLKTF